MLLAWLVNNFCSELFLLKGNNLKLILTYPMSHPTYLILIFFHLIAKTSISYV